VKATVSYFLNHGPTPTHLSHDVTPCARLRDARAAAPTGRGWAIIRAEDMPYRPGRRSVVDASDAAYREAAERLCSDTNRRNGVQPEARP
jgi:hypothetical protein